MYRVLTDGPACFSNAFLARALYASADIVGRGTVPMCGTSPLHFANQNMFAASPVFPGKRLLSLPVSGFLKVRWRYEC